MTRKHYVMIAEAIWANVQDYSSPLEATPIKRVAESIAVRLKQDNAAFDKQRFLVACGFDQE